MKHISSNQRERGLGYERFGTVDYLRNPACQPHRAMLSWKTGVADELHPIVVVG